jgi:hypothetical protein
MCLLYGGNYACPIVQYGVDAHLLTSHACTHGSTPLRHSRPPYAYANKPPQVDALDFALRKKDQASALKELADTKAALDAVLAKIL